MALDIHQMNVMSWGTLVLSKTREGILNTAGWSLHLRKSSKTARETFYCQTCSWWDHPTRERKLCVKDKTQDKIDSEVDKDKLYKRNKMSLDEEEWRNCAFESKLKSIYDIKRPNSMNLIHENEVSKITECNLLYDMLNPFKCTKQLIAITHLLCMYVWIHKRVEQNLIFFESYWIVDVVPCL